MAKYLSNRQKNLKVGIASYTESNTVLEVTGKIGIGTTNATRNLDVAGDSRFRGAIYDANNASGSSGQVLVSIGSGTTWTSVNNISTIQEIINTALTGISVQEESVGIGTSFTTLNFIGAGVTATPNGTTANITFTQQEGPQGIQGITGIQGTIGSQGISGAQGLEGSQGIQGSQGLEGPQGIQGIQGSQGLEGSQGIQGFQGIQGLEGSQGTQGTQGIQGLEGAQGTQGTQGTQGIQGLEGSQGIQGFQGIQGIEGAQGVQGTQGIQGIIGPVAGSNKQIIFNDNDASAGATNFVYDVATQNVGIGTTNPTSKLSVFGNALVTGVVTATTFIGALTGTATTATKLENVRTFEITGDVVASPISFDGTGNVSLAATIQPNSVGLGTDTTGDYVKDITGTANEITVTSGTGEGSSPTLSIPNQFTAPQDVTVTRDLQVNRNLNVNGNITIGGTSATLFTSELKVADPDLVLGFRTDGSGNDTSTDNTANHGGIAIASTEGTPLISLYDVGVGETNPATYKKFMWFKSGTFAGLGTDAWISNYAIGIGSTQVPNGVRLAAGGMQVTDNTLSSPQLNISGISTINQLDVNQLSPDGVDYGTNTYVPIANGSGGWSWGTVASAGAGNLNGIDIREEGNIVGTAGSVTSIDFRGNNIIASSTSGGAIATVRVLDSPTFDNLSVTGVSTISVNSSTDALRITQEGSGNALVVEDSTNPDATPFVITGIGSVGIGTVSPGAKLEIVGSTSQPTYKPIIHFDAISENPFSALYRYTGVANQWRGVRQRVDSSAGNYVLETSDATAIGSHTWTNRLYLSPNGQFEINAASSTSPLITSIGGSEVVRIDSSGRLLVGVSTAQGNNQLQIQADNVDGGGAVFLRLGKNATAISSAGFFLGTINFGNQQGGIGALIRADSDAAWGGTGSTDNPGRIVFATTADGSATPTERMRITSGGLVGIGTVSPDKLLTVNGDIQFANKLVLDATNTASQNGVTAADAVVTTTSASSTQYYAPSAIYTSSSISSPAWNSTSISLRPTNYAGDLVIAAGNAITTHNLNAWSHSVAGNVVIRAGAAYNSTAGANNIRHSYVRGNISFQTATASTQSDSTYTERLVITDTGSVGIGTTNPTYKLHVVGSFGATTKSFIINHPTKEGKKLQYGSLEGPELGVYVRGRTQEATIELPEYWTKLVDAESITVSLTPIGNSATPRVEKVSGNAVYVFSKEEGEMDYYYTVFAERCDVDKLEVEY